MSARAAARLEAFGFDRVYDFVGGKMAWLSSGLPGEGEKSDRVRSGDKTRRDPPTCGPDTAVGDLSDRDDITRWGLVVVVDRNQVVHGTLSAEQLASSSADAAVETVMELGPTTIRPSRSIESALDRINDLGRDHVVVTTEFGELWGILYRSDIEDDDTG